MKIRSESGLVKILFLIHNESPLTDDVVHDHKVKSSVGYINN